MSAFHPKQMSARTDWACAFFLSVSYPRNRSGPSDQTWPALVRKGGLSHRDIPSRSPRFCPPYQDLGRAVRVDLASPLRHPLRHETCSWAPASAVPTARSNFFVTPALCRSSLSASSLFAFPSLARSTLSQASDESSAPVALPVKVARAPVRLRAKPPK